MEEEKIVKIVFEIVLISSLLLVAFIVTIAYFRFKRNAHFKEKKLMQQAFSEQLLQAQLEVQEQTRLHIAEELHDNVGALASLIKINLKLLSITKEPIKFADILEQSQTHIKNLIVDIKHLSVSLHTDRLTHLRIGEAIYFEVQRVEKLDLFTIDFTIKGEDIQLPNDKQIILFRMCQELLHNIVKHAQPTTITVIITFTLNKLEITIIDDGIGFDVEEANKKNNSSGLINLYKRAKVIGGTLYLTSNATSGTHCNIQISMLPQNT